MGCLFYKMKQMYVRRAWEDKINGIFISSPPHPPPPPPTSLKQKLSCFNRIQTHDICDTVQCSGFILKNYSYSKSWIDYQGVPFSIELLEWGRSFSDLWGKIEFFIRIKINNRKRDSEDYQSREWEFLFRFWTKFLAVLQFSAIFCASFRFPINPYVEINKF